MSSFSNNELLNDSALLSFFDSLWIRSDIEKQNIIKQTYFKIFKEPQLKDENYRRKWFSNLQKKRITDNIIDNTSNAYYILP